MANGQVTEKTKVRCAETSARWDALIDRARGLPTAEQRQEFLATAEQMGVVAALALLRAACADPEGAQRITPTPLPRLLDEANVDLTLLEEGVATAERLNVPVRSATIAAGQHAEDTITAAEQARIRAATTQAVLPAVLSIAGGILVTLIGAAVAPR